MGCVLKTESVTCNRQDPNKTQVHKHLSLSFLAKEKDLVELVSSPWQQASQNKLT